LRDGLGLDDVAQLRKPCNKLGPGLSATAKINEKLRSILCSSLQKKEAVPAMFLPMKKSASARFSCSRYNRADKCSATLPNVDFPCCPDHRRSEAAMVEARPAAPLPFVQPLHKARVQTGHDAAMNEMARTQFVRNARRQASNIG